MVANQLILTSGDYPESSRWAQPQGSLREGDSKAEGRTRCHNRSKKLERKEKGARSQAMQVASISWKRQGSGFSPLKAQRECGPADTFRLLTLELRQYIFFV